MKMRSDLLAQIVQDCLKILEEQTRAHSPEYEKLLKELVVQVSIESVFREW